MDEEDKDQFEARLLALRNAVAELLAATNETGRIETLLAKADHAERTLAASGADEIMRLSLYRTELMELAAAAGRAAREKKGPRGSLETPDPDR